MVRMVPMVWLPLFGALLLSGGTAQAETTMESPQGQPPQGPASPSASGGAAPTPTALADGGDVGPVVVAGVPMVDASVQAVTPARWGVGARLRLTSVPKWFMGLALDESVPLTSYTAGIEFFRRSGNLDVVMGLAYQSLSPNAGNWLGKNDNPAQDTDYVQFDGLAAWSFDVAFIMHTEFTRHVGIHYGGGVGIGVINGQVLRTSNGSPGCVSSPGDPSRCFPVVCAQGPCTEDELRGTEPRGNDNYLNPSRFADGHVPTAYPIINIVTGLDVHLPDVKGLAIKFDVGYFFPYFFFGPSVAYQI